jgi:hypothetical protein
LIQTYGKGTSIFKQIVVAGNVNFTIIADGIDVTSSSGSESTFSLPTGTTVNFVLSNDNFLTQTATGDGVNAALNVPSGAIVSIGGSGSLTARGGGGSAGIGGGNGQAAGNIAITGGTVTARGGAGGAGIGGGKSGPAGGSIAITGGTVTARGGSDGAGIGGGQGGSAVALDIAPAATVRAYSQGPDRPAIHASATPGDGFFVNAYLEEALSSENAANLGVYKSGEDSVSNTLTLPAGYRSFAYTTGSDETQNDTILAYDLEGSRLGSVVRVRDSSPQIYSVHTDYSAQEGEYTLPVKLLNTTTVTISNIVTGTYADLAKTFTYLILFKDEEGDPITGETFAYTGSTTAGAIVAPSDGALTTGATGWATLPPLGHGQAITIEDVPIGGSVNIAVTDGGENPGVVGYKTLFNAFTTAEDGSDVTVGEEEAASTGLLGLTDAGPLTVAFTNENTYVPKAGIDAKSGGPLAALLLCLIELLVLIMARRRIAGTRR